jgi:hypothetical protein
LGTRLGDLGNRREISSQFHLQQMEAVMWSRKSILRSKHLPRTLWHKWLETGGGGSLRGVLTQYHQSGKTWLWCHSELTAPWTWRVLRQLLPCLLLWQTSQSSRKKPKEGAPALCWSLLTKVCPREMGGIQSRRHMGDLSPSD